MFQLHPQLEKDCFSIGDLKLCRVLLLNDCQFPWLILVPRRENIKEIFQLELSDQNQLLIESSIVSAELARYFNADKMNVAALGNMVPQLHIHHIVRYETDPVWPKPVWGALPAVVYDDEKLQSRIQALQDLLSKNGLKI